jgi:drug/metabolite transporter (DMT)-like permease
MVGIFFALTAAFSWGAGDFCGGLASRKINQFQVLLLTSASSLLLLILFALFSKENLPSTTDIFIAVIAGMSGALGLAALYRGLSLGNSALVAPTAGVVGAIVPTLTGLFIEGVPSPAILSGYLLSIVGIWLVSHSKDGYGKIARNGLGLAFLAGIGFGGFLALIARIEGDQIFTPLVFSKFASLLLAMILIRIRGLPLPKPTGSPIAISSGFLDAGGNILYLLATQFARLDIAALLSSLYPAGTVLLSGLILKEKLSYRQWIGVGASLTAILLITSG